MAERKWKKRAAGRLENVTFHGSLLSSFISHRDFYFLSQQRHLIKCDRSGSSAFVGFAIGAGVGGTLSHIALPSGIALAHARTLPPIATPTLESNQLLHGVHPLKDADSGVITARITERQLHYYRINQAARIETSLAVIARGGTSADSTRPAQLSSNESHRITKRDNKVARNVK